MCTGLISDYAHCVAVQGHDHGHGHGHGIIYFSCSGIFPGQILRPKVWSSLKSKVIFVTWYLPKDTSPNVMSQVSSSFLQSTLNNMNSLQNLD